MSCTILLLFPNGRADTQGIGLLEVLWKLAEAIFDTKIKMMVKFHYALHGLHAKIGMVMAIIDINMLQELTIIYQDPILLVFLDLWKA